MAEETNNDDNIETIDEALQSTGIEEKEKTTDENPQDQ